MKRRTAPKVNIAFSIAMVLLVLVMASSYMTSGLFARYVSRASGSDSARVAIFDVEQGVYTGTFSVQMNPDAETEQPAIVRVVNSSEVAVRCIFTVTTTGNLPLETYWQDENDQKVTSVDFAPNDTTGAEFKLFVDWIDSDDSYLYHREIDSVTVTITSVQID